jgi:hypothetical protein
VKGEDMSGKDQIEFDMEEEADRAPDTFSSNMLEQGAPEQMAFGDATFDGPVLTLDDLERTYPVRGTPRSHQIRALNEAGLRAGHCYFVDPGGGKTFLCIAEAGKLFEDGEISGVVVVAPNGVHIQWVEQQFPQWCGVETHLGHNQMTDPQLRAFHERCSPFRLSVLAINYEAMHQTRGRRLIWQFVQAHPRFLLIVDESHKVKSHTAKRTKQTMYWALHAAYRRVLSGTPILRGLEDLWSQYEICEPGLAWPHEPIRIEDGNVSTYGILGFRTHYCVTQRLPNNPRAEIIVGYRNEEQLRARVAPYVTRVLSSEFAVMDEPDIIPRHVPLSADQERAYNQMKNNLITQIDAGVIAADNALVQMGKLLQIANGFLYHEDEDDETGLAPNRWEVLSSAKIDVAIDLLAQLDEPVLVWAPFRALQQMFVSACEERDMRVFSYKPGGDIIPQWEAAHNGILVGNQGSSMGVGLNLQHAAANIYLANTFSAEARWQSIKRTDRIGQTRQVRAWDLIAPGTLETTVMAALRRKEEISRRNIDGLRELL